MNKHITKSESSAKCSRQQQQQQQPNTKSQRTQIYIWHTFNASLFVSIQFPIYLSFIHLLSDIKWFSYTHKRTRTHTSIKSGRESVNTKLASISISSLLAWLLVVCVFRCMTVIFFCTYFIRYRVHTSHRSEWNEQNYKTQNQVNKSGARALCNRWWACTTYIYFKNSRIPILDMNETFISHLIRCIELHSMEMAFD